MEECADWISAQLEEEEGIHVDAGLVELMLQYEWAEQPEQRIPKISHERAVEQLLQRLTEAGVEGAPDAIDKRLVMSVLQWEDDFLSFAGRSRLR